MHEILKKGSEELGVALSKEQIEKLIKYSELLVEWNEKINLTAITEPQEIAVKHFLDSLTAIVRGYVTGLFDALRVHGYDARLMKLFVMGGGGCLVKHFGKYDPSAVVFVDDLHASAKGYEYMAQGVIWRNERLARKAGD